MVRVSHMVGPREQNLSKCYGNVLGGVCKKCGISTPGIATYCLKITIYNPSEPRNATIVKVADGGDGLFGMAAPVFHGKSAAQKHKIVSNCLWRKYSADVRIQDDDGE